MADDEGGLDSKTANQNELQLDQADNASENISCEHTAGLGNVVDAVRQDGVDNKCDAKEADLEGIIAGVDEESMREVKDNENNMNLDVYRNEEKGDLRDHGQQHKGAGICMDGELNKFAGEPLHVENKDAKDSSEELEPTDTGEAIGKVNDCGEQYNIDVEGAGENMEIDEKKEFRDENSENLEINKKEEEKENLKDNKLLHKSAEDSLEVEVSKPSCESLHVVEQDAVEAKDELETIDAMEAIGKVNDFGAKDSNRDVEDAVQSMEIDEKKEFRDENYQNLEIVLKEEENENLKDTEEQQKSAGDSLEGKVNKFSCESSNVEKKDDEKDEADFEAIDGKEAIGKGNDFEENDSNRDVEDVRELMEVEEKKDFGPSQGRQVERVVDNLKNGDEKLVEQRVDFDNNGFTEEMEDTGASKSSMQAISNVKDSGEKNGHSNAKADTKNIEGNVDDSHVKDDKEKKGKEEVKAHEVVVRLKDGKDMHNDKEVMDDELKREMLVKNKEETANFNKMSKDLETLEAEIVKEDAGVNEKHEVKDHVSSMENEQEYETKEDDVDEEDDIGNTEMVIDDNEVSDSLKEKRRRRRGSTKRGKTKEHSEAKEKRESKKAVKDLSSPLLSSPRKRPMRERKIVERLVEVIEKGPIPTVVIEKGQGTPLKDIPNVAYKLARKKSADLKFLHSAIFGRKGKAVDFKNNLLQFSGFVWHESEEKQRVKIKERLDKCHKDNLLDLANLFDLNVSKSSTKKEEIILKLLDFMEAPSATTEAIATEKEQLVVSRKRKRDTKTSSSRRLRSTFTEKSRKKSGKTEDIVNSERKISKDMEDEDDEEEKDTENGIPDEDDAPTQSQSDVKATESWEAGEEVEMEGCDSAKGKTEFKTVPKQQSTGISVDRKESSNSKLQTKVAAKSPSKNSSSSKSSKAQQDYTSEKVFARKRRHTKSPKTSKPRRQVKDNSSGKKEKVAVGDHRRSRPSKGDLRKTICEILKEVDFNTATFTDILKMLGMRYKMDMTPRKSSIKQMIQEELSKMADQADEEESGEEEVTGKE